MALAIDAPGVPRLWPGATVAIAGNGPSLRLEDLEACRQTGLRIVVINRGGELFPSADLLWFCDAQFFRWYPDLVTGFPGLVATLENEDLRKHRPDLICLRNAGRMGLCEAPNGVMTGSNSGHQCLNLTYHLGASRILLLGFDMRPGHWFGNYPVQGFPGVYSDTMLPCFPAVAARLAEKGVEVVNCTPDSALDVFPRRDLAAELNGISR